MHSGGPSDVEQREPRSRAVVQEFQGASDDRVLVSSAPMSSSYGGSLEQRCHCFLYDDNRIDTRSFALTPRVQRGPYPVVHHQRVVRVGEPKRFDLRVPGRPEHEIQDTGSGCSEQVRMDFTGRMKSDVAGTACDGA